MASRASVLGFFLVPLVSACGIPVKADWYACDPAVEGACPSGQECVWSTEAGEYRCVESGTSGPECGNGVVEQGEACDEQDFAGTTCQILGYSSGTLACTRACELDDSGCIRPPGCGDGILDPNEDCDGANLGGATCENRGWGAGTLVCTGACLLNPAGCSEPPVCGNGQVEYGEECDDGNTTSCDGCSATCHQDGCGNGSVDCGEVCDDGNTASGDGCSGDCQSDETCGNGIVDTAAGEACDDGNTTGGDGCSGVCLLESCGNGVVDPGEECDDGGVDTETCNANCTFAECGDGYVNGNAGEDCDDSGESTRCDPDCSPAACGDGYVNTSAGEQCDDGGTVACDGCSATCQVEECGNGVTECQEMCDDSNNVGGDGCSADCLSDETCGNGVVDPGEECDDGDLTPCDGCSATCQVEECGNGVTECQEMCDDNNTEGGDGCSADCLSDETCGNGVVDPGEECDDGDLVSGDGCSDQCVSECGIPCPGPTVQSCIDNATTGDVIAVGPGAISDNVIVAGKTITLKGDCTGTMTVWTCANTQDRAIRAQTGANLTVEGFIFEGCNGGTSASFNSGVVLGQGADAVRLVYNIFRNNSSHRGAVLGTYGGSAFPTTAVVLFENNIMHDNQSNDAGVVYISGETNIEFFNNLIYDNSATDYCGAIWLRNQVRAKMSFQKNVVYGNSAARNPALEVYSGEGPIIGSSIVTSNTPSDKASAWGTSYSMIGGNPLFTSPGTGDFSLQSGSPAIDAGDPALPNDPDTTRTDQGCYLQLLPVE